MKKPTGGPPHSSFILPPWGLDSRLAVPRALPWLCGWDTSPSNGHSVFLLTEPVSVER